MTLEEEGIELNDLWYWCDVCQFVSAVHPRPSKARYNAEQHALGVKHQEKLKEKASV